MRSPWIVVGLVISEAILAHASINQARAQSSGSWYYCDPAQAYYPYVSTCAAPWRQVAPTTQTQSPPAPTKAMPQLKPQTTATPFVVAIETSVSGGARPIVTGTTNLPDHTKLLIWLEKPWLPNAQERMAVGLSACGENCFPLGRSTGGTGDTVEVKNGQFSDGPITDWGGAALNPGIYVLVVQIAWSKFEPPDVRAIIGSLGENMTGPLVGACCFGPHITQRDIQKATDQLRKDAPVAGANVYYARYVEIGPNGSAPARSTVAPQTSPITAPASAPTDALTVSEIDLVRQQIEECWNVPAGARDVQNLRPEFRVVMNPDGTVRSAQQLNPERNSDPFFQAAADSARRALLNPTCQPLKLPPDKYDQWKTFTITLDPKDISESTPMQGVVPLSAATTASPGEISES